MMEAHVFRSARELPQGPWQRAVADASCTFSADFAAIVEQSGLNDFQYRYVLFTDDAGAPAAVAVIYAITTDLAIFAPTWLRAALARIRRRFPGFFKIRMLECGTPVTLNSPPFAVTAGTNAVDLVESLDRVLMEMARAEGHLLVVVRDFEPATAPLQAAFRRRRYHLVEGLPNTYLDVRWGSIEQYVGAMKSYFRSKLVKHLRRCREQDISHTLVDSFGAEAEALARQWMVVHNQADEFQREVLTADFYRLLSSRMAGKSKAILFHRGIETIGHALLLLDGDLLRWLYFGREQAVNDSLYIYVGHAVVDAAIRLGARRIEMGLTTYPVKLDLGAEAVPLRMALRSPIALVNPLVGPIYGLLNRPPKVRGDRNVFKRPAGHQAQA